MLRNAKVVSTVETITGRLHPNVETKNVTTVTCTHFSGNGYLSLIHI